MRVLTCSFVCRQSQGSVDEEGQEGEDSQEGCEGGEDSQDGCEGGEECQESEGGEGQGVLLLCWCVLCVLCLFSFFSQ